MEVGEAQAAPEVGEGLLTSRNEGCPTGRQQPAGTQQRRHRPPHASDKRRHSARTGHGSCRHSLKQELAGDEQWRRQEGERNEGEGEDETIRGCGVLH